MNRIGRTALGLLLAAIAGLAIPACGKSSSSSPAVPTPGTLQFSAATFSVGEDAASATITVTRAGGSLGAVSVHYDTSDGSATEGSDYTAASGTLSWADGDAASKTFTVAPSGDALAEGDETVNLTLSLPLGGAVLGTQDTAVLSILDADAPFGALQFSSGTYSVNEGAGTATITVTRSGGSAGAVGVTYATTAGGTATAGTDYTAIVGSTLSWAAGETGSKTFAVTITDDATPGEGSETVNLALSLATGGASLGTTSAAVLTIMDNDSPGVLAFESATYETTESAGTLTIKVTRTGGSMGAVGVTYATSNGTATAGTDYTAIVGGTLSWADGDVATKSFTVTLTNDTTVENDETFDVTLSSATGGATIGGTNPTVVTILEDDVTLQFLAAAYSVQEGVGIIDTITVTRLGGHVGAVGVTYDTSDGTATAGTDYTAIAGGTLSWADEDTAAKSFAVTVVNDVLAEADETVNLTLSSPTGGATLGTPSAATLTLIDNGGDNTPPVVSFTMPDNAATSVWTNTNITATFSEDMQAATIDATSFTISPVVAGTVTYNAATRTATFDPTGNLAASTTYTMTITTGVRDAAGNAMAADKVWSFTTGLGPDSGAPGVSSVNPAGGATTVALDRHMVITFDEPMDFASVASATTVSSVPATTPSMQFYWSLDGKVVTVVFDTVGPIGIITGDDILAENTTYTVTVGTGAKDLAGNTMVAEYPTTFTTKADGTPPQLVSISPDPSLLIPASTTMITVTFNEPMNTTQASVGLQIGIGMGGSAATGSLPAQGGDNLTLTWTSSTVLTITRNGFTFSPGTCYEFRINSLSDAAGNYMNDGVKEYLTIVGSGSDTTAPTITCMGPTDGSTGVNRDTGIVVAFSESMDPDIVNHITVTDPGATPVTKLNQGFGVMINPLRAWPANSTVTVTIEAGAQDTSGNAITETSFSFTTGAGDSNPMVLDEPYCSIVNGVTKYATSPYFNWILKFKNSGTGKEAYVNASTLQTQDVSVFEKATGIPLKGYTVKVDEDLGGLRIDHMNSIGGSQNLKENTAYVIRLNGTLKNTAGVPIPPTSIEFTTHALAANCRPRVAGGIGASLITMAGVGELAELRLGVGDDDGVPTGISVVATDSPDVAFSRTLSYSASNYAWEYKSSADEANITSTGDHVITYTISDGTDSVTMSVRAYVFNTLPTQSPASGNPGSYTPTFTWTAANADVTAFMLVIQDPSGADTYTAILDGRATSYTLPADRALATGTGYSWLLVAVHFGDNVLRTGARPPMGLIGPSSFDIPLP